MDEIIKIIQLIEKSIKEDPENLITWWNIISDDFDKQVDYYRKVISSSKDWLSQYQSNLVKSTWITTLKIKFTAISWYFIEVPRSQINKVPDNFIHKQTLVNAWRFITNDIKEFEGKLLEAEWSLANREYDLFLEIRKDILDNFKIIKSFSEKSSYIDFYTTLSEVAYMNNYSKPKIVEDKTLEIIWGRHVIIEQIEDNFISNDLKFSQKDYIHIITWPNMWWKSTFLRQNALIVLLSHIWSYVPAEKAIIPLCDRIFSRVWATDNLYLWQSTFMVEMQEIANILNNSTEKSFVIIDEVWRWTSTYDGMSLAWAILKENHDNIKAYTLFATHYHELIDESIKLKWVSNYSVAVWESEDSLGWKLIFLRKIILGGIKKSFWLEVAKLAWVSFNVIKEAKNMLKFLEHEHKKTNQMTLWSFNSEPEIKIIKKESEIEKQLKKIDVNNLTPMQALNKLNELIKLIKKIDN